MIKFFAFVCLFFMSVISAYGEVQYVTDVFPVMVRTGPDLSNKIIAMPKSGAAVEVVEVPDEQRVEEWVKVRLSSGKEGWMLDQFLVPGPPKHEIIARLEKENDTLKKRVTVLAEENSRIKKERKELESALASQTQTGKGLKQAYEELKQGSKDFLALKASHDAASRELVVKKKQLDSLKKEVEGLRSSQTLRWFIAGASIILVGFIIGYISKRPKRRPSLL